MGPTMLTEIPDDANKTVKLVLDVQRALIEKKKFEKKVNARRKKLEASLNLEENVQTAKERKAKFEQKVTATMDRLEADVQRAKFEERFASKQAQREFNEKRAKITEEVMKANEQRQKILEAITMIELTLNTEAKASTGVKQ